MRLPVGTKRGYKEEGAAQLTFMSFPLTAIDHRSWDILFDGICHHNPNL